MSSSFVLRRARPEDAAALVEGNAALALESESLVLDPAKLRPGVDALLAHPERGFYIVAEDAGRVMGHLMLTPEWSDWRNAFFFWIQSVYVWPEWRRKGVYRALHGEAVRAARELGSCGLRLYVEQENARAQATYLALGMARSHYDLFEEPLTEGPARIAP